MQNRIRIILENSDRFKFLKRKSQFLNRLRFILTTIFLGIFFFSCSQDFPKGKLFDVVILWKLIPVTPVPTSNGTPTPVTPTTNDKKYFFITANTNANLGGITGADSYCQSQKNASFSSLAGIASEYKAFLVDGTTRIACSTANCSGGVSENVNWVLKANTDYYRTDDTKILTTNSAGIVNFGSGSLLAVIDTSGSIFWWTGLATDWTFNSACTVAWASTTGLASRGVGGVTTNTSIDTGSLQNCSTSTTKLLCVRQ